MNHLELKKLLLNKIGYYWERKASKIGENRLPWEKRRYPRGGSQRSAERLSVVEKPLEKQAKKCIKREREENESGYDCKERPLISRNNSQTSAA